MAVLPKIPPIPKLGPPRAHEGPQVVVPLANATLVITNDMVVQARRYVQSGATTGRTVEWRDSKQTGLVLRMTSKSASWLLRRRRNTFTIGSADEISILTARSLASSAIHIDNLDSNAHLYLEKMRHVLRTEGSEAAYYYDQKMWIDEKDGQLHGPEVPMPDDAWTWSHLRTRFIAFKTPKLCPAWAPQVERLLMHRAFDSIKDRAVAEIGLDELVEVKTALKDQLSASQASRALSHTKAMLGWAYQEHPKQNGFDAKTSHWWLHLTIEHERKKRFIPTGADHNR